MKRLTIFTPTFNRKHLLLRLYESLKKQSDKNFIWMVIDDGSVDGTEELIEQWQKEGLIEIKYYFKENEGMHSAHNLAYENISTEWNTCIDSDDMMPENAVELILKNMTSCTSEKCYGLVGLDADFNFKVLGQKFPQHLNQLKMMELQIKHKVAGDKKLVYKTSVIKKLPAYPIFDGEKLVPLSYKSFEAEKKGYYLKSTNEILCLVEYQQDGSTKNMWRQYRQNPQGFAFMRLKKLNSILGLKEIVKNSLHLGSSVFFTKKFRQLLHNKYPIAVVGLLPVALLLNFYIRYKTKALK